MGFGPVEARGFGIFRVKGWILDKLVAYRSCKNRCNCRKKDLCGKDCTRKSAQYCKLCPSCNTNCEEYVEEICTARFRAPYVCNGCDTIRKCTLLKNIYDAERAHIKSHKTITQSRSGLCVSEKEISRLNKIISPLIQNGQSVNQVYINHVLKFVAADNDAFFHIVRYLSGPCAGGAGADYGKAVLQQYVADFQSVVLFGKHNDDVSQFHASPRRIFSRCMSEI